MPWLTCLGNPKFSNPQSEMDNAMALPIYKPGQGYWTRVLSAIGAGTLVLAGAAWLWSFILPRYVDRENLIYIQSGVAVSVIVGFGLLIYFLLNKPNIVDFMIAVEAEMKKVNWPSQERDHRLNLGRDLRHAAPRAPAVPDQPRLRLGLHRDRHPGPDRGAPRHHQPAGDPRRAAGMSLWTDGGAAMLE